MGGGRIFGGGCIFERLSYSRLQEKHPGNLHKFKQFTDVTSWQLQYLIQALNIGLIRVILMTFSAVRMWFSGNTFAAGSTTEVKQKTSTKNIVQSAHSSAIKRLLNTEMEWA